MYNAIENPKSCWLLIPVHNRCELTKNCLNRLREIEVLEKYTVCVIDDASSDGTREMLETEFSSVVRVQGDGDLFWGGGIAHGMEYARSHGAEIYFWLNDDCLPAQGSIERLVNRVMNTKGICGGICFEKDGETLAYSGTVLKRGELRKVHPPKGSYADVEFLNGNLVAIHRDVVDQIGFVDSANYLHYGGDSEYAYRAVNHGIKVEVDGGASAINPRGHYYTRFKSRSDLLKLWRDMFWKGSPNYFPSYIKFLYLRFGLHAIYRWLAYFVRMCNRSCTLILRGKL